MANTAPTGDPFEALGDPNRRRIVELLRGAQVSVDAPEPLPIELDGEQPGTTPARFEVVPQALRVRVPG